MTAAQAFQLAVDGLVIGALYALVGLGVVIVYRATRILNFAQGAIATTAGYAAAQLDHGGLPYAGSLALAVAAGLLIGALLGVLMTYAFPRAGAIEKSIATLGVAFVLTWFNRTTFGDIPKTLPQVFSRDLHLAGAIIPGHGLYLMAVAAVALLFVMWLVNRTRLGLAMRALSQDAPIARANGVSLPVVSISSWAIASALAALAGVLVTSFVQVDQSVMTVISIQALAALVLGGFGTAVGAIVGGPALGLVSSLAAGYLDPAYKNTFVFAAVLLMLVLRPEGIAGRRELIVAESGDVEERPSLPADGRIRRRHLLYAVVAIVLVGALPFVPQPFPLVTYSVLFSTAVVVAGLGLLMGYIGEVSLGHGALATIGAYVTAWVLIHAGAVSLPLALGFAVLASAAAGAIVGAATLRLSGLYLAIATMALTFVIAELGLRWRDVTGGPLGLGVPSPFGAGRLTSALGTYYLAAGGFLATAVLLFFLLRSRMAISWVAIRDIPVASMVSGVRVRRRKVAGFTLSSAIAGLGGGLLAIVVTHVGPYDYGLDWSFLVILAAVLGGTGSIAGAVAGAAVITLLPAAVNTSAVSDLVFGAAIVVLMSVAPRGIPGMVETVARTIPFLARDRRARPTIPSPAP